MNYNYAACCINRMHLKRYLIRNSVCSVIVVFMFLYDELMVVASYRCGPLATSQSRTLLGLPVLNRGRLNNGKFKSKFVLYRSIVKMISILFRRTQIDQTRRSNLLCGNTHSSKCFRYFLLNCKEARANFTAQICVIVTHVN